jgi:hypothetical protein
MMIMRKLHRSTIVGELAAIFRSIHQKRGLRSG